METFLYMKNINIKMEDKIMNFFYKNSYLNVNIRTLAQKLKLNHTSVRIHLNKLQKENNLKVKKGNLEHLFSLNINSNKIKIKKRLWNIESLYESGLIDYLDEIFESPKSIVLFGSYGFGEDSERSDIDIAIQTSIKKNPKLEKYEKKLNHKIQIFNFDKNNEENLLNSIYNGVVMKGRIQ